MEFAVFHPSMTRLLVAVVGLTALACATAKEMEPRLSFHLIEAARREPGPGDELGLFVPRFTACGDCIDREMTFAGRKFSFRSERLPRAELRGSEITKARVAALPVPLIGGKRWIVSIVPAPDISERLRTIFSAYVFDRVLVVMDERVLGVSDIETWSVGIPIAQLLSRDEAMRLASQLSMDVEDDE